ARLQEIREEDPFRGAPLVRRDDVSVAGEILNDIAEAKEGTAAGVRLVPFDHRRPLPRRHRAGPGVGQQVDDHIVAVQQEDVVSGRLQRLLTLFVRGQMNRLDSLDAKGLHDQRGHFFSLFRDTKFWDTKSEMQNAERRIEKRDARSTTSILNSQFCVLRSAFRCRLDYRFTALTPANSTIR